MPPPSRPRAVNSPSAQRQRRPRAMRSRRRQRPAGTTGARSDTAASPAAAPTGRGPRRRGQHGPPAPVAGQHCVGLVLALRQQAQSQRQAQARDSRSSSAYPPRGPAQASAKSTTRASARGCRRLPHPAGANAAAPGPAGPGTEIEQPGCMQAHGVSVRCSSQRRPIASNGEARRPIGPRWSPPTRRAPTARAGRLNRLLRLFMLGASDHPVPVASLWPPQPCCVALCSNPRDAAAPCQASRPPARSRRLLQQPMGLVEATHFSAPSPRAETMFRSRLRTSSMQAWGPRGATAHA